MYTMQLMLDCKKIALDNGFKPRGTQFVYGMAWLSFVVFFCVFCVFKAGCSYTDVGRSIGWWGVALVNLNVIMCNLGACAGYLIFIGVNMQSSFKCVIWLLFAAH